MFICFGFFCYDNVIANRYSSDKYQIVVKKLTKKKQTNKKTASRRNKSPSFGHEKMHAMAGHNLDDKVSSFSGNKNLAYI